MDVNAGLAGSRATYSTQATLQWQDILGATNVINRELIAN